MTRQLNRWKMLIAAALCLLLLMAGARVSRADEGGAVSVSFNGYIPFGAFGDTNDADLTIDGGIAYCLNPEMHAPDNGVYPAQYYSMTDSTPLANILYYGYGGPGDITGQYDLTAAERHVLTHLAAARAFGGNWTYKVSEWGVRQVERFAADAAQMPQITGAVLVFCQYEGGQNVGRLVSWTLPEKPKGYLRLQKYSTAEQITAGNAAYSLAGAQYTVFEDPECRIPAASFAPTDEAGVTDLLMLPPGTYWIRETTASAGYHLSSAVTAAEVTAAQTEAEAVLVQVPEEPVLGNLSFQKTAAESGAPIAGVPFRVTAVSGDFSKVIITGPDGLASTADVNGSPVLPLGDYLVEELRCDANYGRVPVSFTVSVTADQPDVRTGPVVNLPIEIGTSAQSSAGEQDGAAEKVQTAEATPDGTDSAARETVITDRVSVKNLTEGKEYVLKGVLMDRESAEPLRIGGKEIRAEERFTVSGETETVEMRFLLNAEELAGRSVVVFEYLYEEDVQIAEHTDLNDAAQTVTFPEKPEEPEPEEPEKPAEPEKPQVPEVTPQPEKPEAPVAAVSPKTGDENDPLSVPAAAAAGAAVLLLIVYRKKKRMSGAENHR